MIKKITIKQLEEKNRNLEDKLKELEENWKRALADYQNLQKRVQQEREEWRKIATKDFLTSLLPFFDSLYQATKHIKDNGFSFALKQLADILRNKGVEQIKTVGLVFDPKIMEAVEVVKSDTDGIVIEEILPGYKIDGQALLRPAKVKVGKKDVDQKEEEKAKEELQRGNYM